MTKIKENKLKKKLKNKNFPKDKKNKKLKNRPSSNNIQNVKVKIKIGDKIQEPSRSSIFPQVIQQPSNGSGIDMNVFRDIANNLKQAKPINNLVAPTPMHGMRQQIPTNTKDAASQGFSRSDQYGNFSSSSPLRYQQLDPEYVPFTPSFSSRLQREPAPMVSGRVHRSASNPNHSFGGDQRGQMIFAADSDPETVAIRRPKRYKKKKPEDEKKSNDDSPDIINEDDKE